MRNSNEKIITNFTIDSFLDTFNQIKACIRYDRWTIEQNENRIENQEFIDNYNLTTKKIKEILMCIKIDDFCYATSHSRKKNILLYIFAPKVVLYNSQNDQEYVDMYIKFRIYEFKHEPTTLVTISFHKLNRSISYLFK